MDIFNALAVPTRRSILEMLASKGRLSATAICNNFDVTPPAISQHLKVLREAKLVQMEKRGQQHIYQIKPDAMRELEKWVKRMTKMWDERFDALDRLLLKEKKKYGKKNQTKITAEPGKQELFITREFDAPRELVFKAYTDPELYVQWLGPGDLTMTLEKFEPKTGGSWRYIHRDKTGNAYGFHGVNHEVLPPERIIGTFEFEGLPETGHVALDTAKFEELPGGRTRVISQSVFQSVADRDGMLQSGMERGVNDSHQRLDDLLEKARKSPRSATP